MPSVGDSRDSVMADPSSDPTCVWIDAGEKGKTDAGKKARCSEDQAGTAKHESLLHIGVDVDVTIACQGKIYCQKTESLLRDAGRGKVTGR